MDWDEAQPWCNFVLMRPAACSVESMKMRPEAPPGRKEEAAGSEGRPTWTVANRSCHRSEIVMGTRRLRVKEFLYDFAPPAFDHPSLWRSKVRGFPVGGHIGWVGTDFRGKQGASLHSERTMIELSVIDGALSDEELVDVLQRFEPAVCAARDLIDQTSLADLAYASRHSEPVIEVPVGYWAHQRRPADMKTTIYPGADAPPELPGRGIAPPPAAGFRLDSVFVFGPPAAPQEVDYVYEHRDDRGRYMRVLASRAGTANGIAFPPKLDEQPCSSETIELGGTTVHHAFLDRSFGPHECVWQSHGDTVMLLVKPVPSMDREGFFALLERMLR